MVSRPCPSSPGGVQALQAMPELPRPCPCHLPPAHSTLGCPRCHDTMPAGARGRWAAGASPRHLAAGGARKWEYSKPGCWKPTVSRQGGCLRACQVLPGPAAEDFLPLGTAGRIRHRSAGWAEIRRSELFLPGQSQPPAFSQLHARGADMGMCPQSRLQGKALGAVCESRISLWTGLKTSQGQRGD